MQRRPLRPYSCNDAAIPAASSLFKKAAFPSETACCLFAFSFCALKCRYFRRSECVPGLASWNVPTVQLLWGEEAPKGVFLASRISSVLQMQTFSSAWVLH